MHAGRGWNYQVILRLMTGHVKIWHTPHSSLTCSGRRQAQQWGFYTGSQSLPLISEHNGSPLTKRVPQKATQCVLFVLLQLLQHLLDTPVGCRGACWRQVLQLAMQGRSFTSITGVSGIYPPCIRPIPKVLHACCSLNWIEQRLDAQFRKFFRPWQARELSRQVGLPQEGMRMHKSISRWVYMGQKRRAKMQWCLHSWWVSTSICSHHVKFNLFWKNYSIKLFNLPQASHLSHLPHLSHHPPQKKVTTGPLTSPRCIPWGEIAGHHVPGDSQKLIMSPGVEALPVSRVANWKPLTPFVG